MPCRSVNLRIFLLLIFMHLFVSSNVSAVIAINFVRLPDLSKRFLVRCKVIHFLTVIKQIFY